MHMVRVTVLSGDTPRRWAVPARAGHSVPVLPLLSKQPRLPLASPVCGTASSQTHA